MAKNRTARKQRPEQWACLFRFDIERPWLVPGLLALLTGVYFFEFVSSDKVVFGNDIGRDFHRGKELFSEKLSTFGPGIWDRQLGGFPSSEEIRKDFFPTSPLALFTTYQRHIGWRYILTVFFAGWGMYLYLRSVRIGPWPSLWAGVAFMSAPTFMTFTFAGHYAKMTVIALLPWMYWCLHRGMQHGRLSHFLWLSVLIGVGAYSPHVQMLQYALLAVGGYFVSHLFVLYRRQHLRRMMVSRTGLFALAVVLGIGLGSEGLFPPYLHAKDESKRAEQARGSSGDDLALARSWSLHPEEIGSLIVPEFGGFYNPQTTRNQYWGRNPGKYNSEYFGVVVILLAIPAVFLCRQNRLVAFMCGLFAVALAFTLGGHTPVHWIAAHLLPGGKVLRSVGMAAFLFSFPATVLAAVGLHTMSKGEGVDDRLLKHLMVAGGCLTALCALITVIPHTILEVWIKTAYSDITPQKLQIMTAGVTDLVRGGLCATAICAAATALTWAISRKKIAVSLASIALIALTLFDTWRIDKLFLVYEDPSHWPDKRLENRHTVDFLKRDGDLFRVFPIPSFELLRTPGYHLDDVDVVTGFNNYTIRRYDRLIGEFEPVLSLFSARLSGREIPYHDDQLLSAIEPLLNLVNTRYLVTPKSIQLHSERFPEVFSQENVRLYENSRALPWYYLTPSYRLETDEETALLLLRDGRVNPRITPILEQMPSGDLPSDPVTVDLSSDRVELLERAHDGSRMILEVRALSPRLLIVSENFYPNWNAYVDGEEVPILRANFVWKAVYVPEGSHRIEFSYRSATVFFARTVTVISIVAMAALGLMAYRRRRQNEAPLQGV